MFRKIPFILISGKPVSQLCKSIEGSSKIIFISIFGFICTGCGGQSGGNAPSPQVVPPVVDTSIESNFKFGETVSASSGWEVSVDTTDPVENVTLANGWAIEVKYE